MGSSRIHIMVFLAVVITAFWASVGHWNMGGVWCYKISGLHCCYLTKSLIRLLGSNVKYLSVGFQFLLLSLKSHCVDTRDVWSGSDVLKKSPSVPKLMKGPELLKISDHCLIFYVCLLSPENTLMSKLIFSATVEFQILHKRLHVGMVSASDLQTLNRFFKWLGSNLKLYLLDSVTTNMLSNKPEAQSHYIINFIYNKIYMCWWLVRVELIGFAFFCSFVIIQEWFYSKEQYTNGFVNVAF